MKNIPNGFAALLRVSLGARWEHLHPDIRARFTPAPGASRQRFTGSMSGIDRSVIGWLIARVIAFVRVLPAVRVRATCHLNSTSRPHPARAGSRSGCITLIATKAGALNSAQS